MSTLPNPRPIYNPAISAPVRDEKHLAWIRTLPCAVCGTRFRVEAAHTGVRGLSQIADDRTAIPLCFRHHDRGQPHSYHKLGPVKFQALYSLDIAFLVAKLTEKPQIRIYGSLYVAIIDGAEWQLLPLSEGMERSQRAAIAIAKDVRREWLVNWLAARPR